jgi:hypothetical protein
VCEPPVATDIEKLGAILVGAALATLIELAALYTPLAVVQDFLENPLNTVPSEEKIIAFDGIFFVLAVALIKGTSIP